MQELTEISAQALPFPFVYAFEIIGPQTSLNLELEPQSQSQITLATTPAKYQALKADFAGFIEAEENTHALRAFQNLGEVPSPLTCVGGAGSGKSHLLHAALNVAEKKSMLVTGEGFLREFVEHVRLKTTPQFQRKYRNLDLLLVDDITCFKKAPRTQEEFYSLLDDFERSSKRVAVALPVRPDLIAGLDKGLVSRLSSGLVVELGAPTVGLRARVLEASCLEFGVRLSAEVLSRLSVACDADLRSVRGLANRVCFMFAGRTDALGLAEIARFVKLPSVDGQFSSVERIFDFVCRTTGESRADIISKSRKAHLVRARRMIFSLMREHLDYSYAEIGRHVGFRDSSTVQAALAGLMPHADSQLGAKSMRMTPPVEFTSAAEKNCVSPNVSFRTAVHPTNKISLESN